MANETIPEVRSGEPITAAWANALVRAIRRALRVTVAYPLELQQGQHGTHVRLAHQSEPRLFELSDTLSAGSSAPAGRLRFDASDWTTSGETETLYDSLGTFSGTSGDRAWAFFSRESGRWEILQLECNP